MIKYKPNDLELWVSRIYRRNRILNPNDLDIDYIAEMFDCEIGVTNGPARTYWDDKFGLILLTSHLSEREKRAQFFHELCHPLRHAGNQHRMPKMFVELQEMQANVFALYAALPFYMLNDFLHINTQQSLIHEIANSFNLPTAFVIKRIDQIERRRYQWPA